MLRQRYQSVHLGLKHCAHTVVDVDARTRLIICVRRKWPQLSARWVDSGGQVAPNDLKFMEKLHFSGTERPNTGTEQLRHLYIFLNFSEFLYMSLNFFVFFCISLNFSEFFRFFMHYSAFLYISLHFSTFLCIS